MRKLFLLIFVFIIFVFSGCALKDPGPQYDLAPSPGFRMSDKDHITALASGDRFLIEDVSDSGDTKYTTTDNINTYLGSIYQPLTAYLTDLGDGNITSNFVNETYPWAVNEGGTGAATFTDGGILLGSGTGAITALGVASNGQIPIGDNTTDPVLATITGTANEVTVTNGAGSITLSLASGINATKIADGSVGNTEFQRIDGITDAGQTLISDGNITAQRATLGLADTTNATASGAYYIGAYDEFANSTGNDTQTILDDLDAALDLRCLESVFGTSIGTGLLLDSAVLKASVILQKYHGVDPSADVLTMLGSANNTVIRSNIGVEVGVDVQAYDADLTTYAGITPSADVQTMLGSDNNTVILSNIGAEPDLVNKAGLYAALSDASHFYELGDNVTIYYGTTPPSTCAVGQIFCDTDEDTDGSLLLCVSTNTWKDVGMGPDKDKITEGDSNVEVIDAGTGQVDIDIDGVLKARINGTGLDVNGTVVCDGIEVGAVASPRVRALDSGCPGTDKFTGSIDWNHIDGGDGAENSGIYIKSQEGGANTTQIQYTPAAGWQIPSGKNLALLGGSIAGRTPIGSDITANQALNTTDLHGKFYIVTAACTVTLDKVTDAGFGATVMLFIRDAAETCIVEVDDADKINLHGTSLDAGDTIDSPGNAGDYVSLISHTNVDGSGTDGWIVVGYGESTWSDGGAS